MTESYSVQHRHATGTLLWTEDINADGGWYVAPWTPIQRRVGEDAEQAVEVVGRMSHCFAVGVSCLSR